MTKIIKLLTALILVLTISFAAVAEEGAKAASFNDGAINLTVPEKWNELQGVMYPMEIGEIDRDLKISLSIFAYMPLGDEDWALMEQANNNAELTEEQSSRLLEILGNMVQLYNFFTIGNGKTFEDVQDAILKGDSPDDYNVYELGQAGEYRFYLQVVKADSEQTKKAVESFPEECREEYIDLLNDAETVKAAVTVQEPVRAGEGAVGMVISFELNDFNGDPVKSEDLFAGRKVTLVNLWASWCGPCAAEMPELEAIWQEYGAKGAGVIGICLDGYKEKRLADAKKVATEGGVTYPMLACTEELEKSLMSIVAAYPTTVFVNEKGEIIGEPVIGVKTNVYRETLDAALAE